MERQAGAGFVRFGLIFYGVLAAAAVLWRIGVYGEPILYASAADAERGLRPLRDLAVGLGAGGAVLLLSAWMTYRTRWGERLAQILGQSLAGLGVADALLLALASGLAEELFFRGALQPRVGWVAASLIFGVIHFAPRREMLPWTGFAIAAGFLFGALFIWTGNLIAPVTAHVLVNGVNLPLLIRQFGQAPPSARPDDGSEQGDGVDLDPGAQG